MEDVRRLWTPTVEDECDEFGLQLWKMKARCGGKHMLTKWLSVCDHEWPVASVWVLVVKIASPQPRNQHPSHRGHQHRCCPGGLPRRRLAVPTGRLASPTSDESCCCPASPLPGLHGKVQVNLCSDCGRHIDWRRHKLELNLGIGSQIHSKSSHRSASRQSDHAPTACEGLSFSASRTMLHP